MSRTSRINEYRAARTRWMNEARLTSRELLPVRFAECIRKARFHHANLMAVKLAVWS